MSNLHPRELISSADYARAVADILDSAAAEAEDWLAQGVPGYAPDLPPDEIRASAQRIRDCGGQVALGVFGYGPAEPNH